MSSARGRKVPDSPGSAERADFVELGCIVGAHGLRGEVRVRCFGDDPENLLDAETIWLGEGREDARAKSVAVRSAGPGRPNEVRLGLVGISDRDAAQALRGTLVLARAEALAPLAANEFYWHELVGCDVVTETGVSVGSVAEIWETGAHDVLVVRDTEGRQNLVPTARELTREIDREGRRIVVADLPGLLDLGDAADTSDPDGLANADG
ncbi:MAG: ribosome maturation factor RimM [Myxococcota bacterium]|jgi:16S rRNA processing protein RimM|nr:ribosome maturation factor RimM [Myxococcota bacterium]